MKKFFAFFTIALLIILSILIYFRANLTSMYLSHEFKLPVKVGNVYLSTSRLVLQDFVIKNPANSHSEYALYAKQISIYYKLSELWKKNTTIDSINLSHIHLWVEQYNKSGSDNNWAKLLSNPPPITSEKETSFLIKTLKFKQLSPALVYSNGSRKKGFAIGELTYHNITNKKHYSHASLERGILDMLLPSAFKSLGVEQLLPTLETTYLEQPFIPHYMR